MLQSFKIIIRKMISRAQFFFIIIIFQLFPKFCLLAITLVTKHILPKGLSIQQNGGTIKLGFNSGIQEKRKGAAWWRKLCSKSP